MNLWYEPWQSDCHVSVFYGDILWCCLLCAHFSIFFLFFCIPNYISGVHNFLVWFLRMWPFFESNHRGSHILSLWMVHAGCVFVASFHPSRTSMLGFFESMQWNACVHRLDFGLSSHPKELGNGVRTLVHSKGKVPSTGGSEEVRTCNIVSASSELKTLSTELFQPPLFNQVFFIPALIWLQALVSSAFFTTFNTLCLWSWQKITRSKPCLIHFLGEFSADHHEI